MLVDEIKQTTFAASTYEEWQALATKSLRGLPFDKLITKTIEGIDLYPLYTEQSSKLESLHPIREAKQEADWTIAQQQYVDNANDFIRNMKESFERGNEAIVYDGSNPVDWNDKALIELAQLAIQYPIYFLKIDQKDTIINVFQHIADQDKERVKGVVDIGQDQMPNGFINIRTIGADVTEAHHLGADAVTELALVIAKAADNASNQEAFEALNKQFFVRFAVDTHFFMEIAKLRAFRVLWEALSVAYGNKQVDAVPVLTETSLRSYATLDPYVNLLRAGNSAFSAILGGADVLTVHPHDVLTRPTETSIRLARNVQLVIQEETLVSEVLDPAGGSYFIESLTKELVEKAWKRFIEIEEQGGYAAYIKSEQYMAYIDQLHKKRLASVAKTSSSLIGTNVYADLLGDEEKEASLSIKGRLAEPFEKFRISFEQNQPKVALVTFGQLKDFKPRADFVSGFLATGGIKTESTAELATVEEAVNWIRARQPDYVVVCATNEMTEQVMTPLLQKLPTELTIDVAGKYSEELSSHWQENGLNGFIYNGLDKLEKFNEILDRWEGDGKVDKAEFSKCKSIKSNG
ncbi:methylmalonyl-CoA mutase family protein [Sporosarcina ureilytica]|uniref:Methylmalonyl-CoA mutase alpha/beta chain catalytic domain-containing protein n=1 Tax=Sporosarcina ureilytica TaxID=298596 RepID=A0A1D8JGH6_9BACL|nr:methylmalonyl-CoA mutase family protein [Sporosarcina ureilytica]AOV07801.1 hypothetical protein BI350_09815 [Sporosarcina ureilytica]